MLMRCRRTCRPSTRPNKLRTWTRYRRSRAARIPASSTQQTLRVTPCVGTATLPARTLLDAPLGLGWQTLLHVGLTLWPPQQAGSWIFTADCPMHKLPAASHVPRVLPRTLALCSVMLCRCGASIRSHPWPAADAWRPRWARASGPRPGPRSCAAATPRCRAAARAPARRCAPGP